MPNIQSALSILQTQTFVHAVGMMVPGVMCFLRGGRADRGGRNGLKAALALGTVLFSAIAAGLWWYASRVEVSPKEADALEKARFKQTGKDRPIALSFTGTSDLQHTLDAQSRWSRRAALTAGAAAACQALYVAVSEFAS